MPSQDRNRTFRGNREIVAMLLIGLLLGGHAEAATLGEAVSAALEVAAQQPRVEALRQEKDAVRRQAGSLVARDPDLRVKYLSDRFNRDDGAYEAEAMVDLPMWLPGQRGARREIANAFDSQAQSLGRFLRWEMAGTVREAAWDAALAQGRLRQAAAALNSARALEADVGKRVDAGELARVELLVARQDTLAREVDLQSAQLDYDRAIHSYIHLTGLTALPDPLNETRLDAEAVPEDHPSLLDIGSAVAMARAERERVQSERRGHPILSVGGKQVRDARGLDSVDALQLEVNIPFGLGSQSAPELAGAERALTERVTEQSRIRLETEHALHEAHLERVGAADALAVAQRRQSLTQDALGLVRRAFELGELDLTDLLRAEERAREANLALELRRLEQGRAVARLNQALGVVPE